VRYYLPLSAAIAVVVVGMDSCYYSPRSAGSGLIAGMDRLQVPEPLLARIAGPADVPL